MVTIIRVPQLILCRVFYYIPETVILNWFSFQTEDVIPDIPKIYRFLDFWHDNIHATLSSVEISHTDHTDWHKIDFTVSMYRLNFLN